VTSHLHRVIKLTCTEVSWSCTSCISKSWRETREPGSSLFKQKHNPLRNRPIRIHRVKSSESKDLRKNLGLSWQKWLKPVNPI
jgi:hypothetical protein